MITYTFNRTILELKQGALGFSSLPLDTFNRTILELKQLIRHKCKNQVHPFNRTILELKQGALGFSSLPLDLLIVPFWN